MKCDLSLGAGILVIPLSVGMLVIAFEPTGHRGSISGWIWGVVSLVGIGLLFWRACR